LKFQRNSKGVSGILAAIFLVLILLLLYTQVYSFIQNENARFQSAVGEVNQMDAERNNEELAVSDLEYDVVGDNVHVTIQVKNIGPVSVQIVNLWVIDKTINDYGFNDTLNIQLNPGDIDYFTESNVLKIQLKGSNSSNIFASWFVTSNGNLIPLEKAGETQQVVIAQVALGIGALAMDFDAFRYFTFETTDKLADYPNGITGFDIPRGIYVAFGCHLTNYDLKKRTITVDAHSLFWQPGRAAVAEGSWFVVNVNNDGTINETYTDITLEYGERKMIVFASKFDLSIGSFDRLKTPNAVATVATFLLLHGTLDNDAFAQSIPFVSLFYN
jgi:archaellum component FlaF (FlaF/FlaG flagellin family)